ncbi:MAG: SulP family inorganic anion transporter [Betaproteobacteria bacterium]|nr:SulP family inorganic anion transporter [Betaproteobacteria bacterium]MBA3775079.1 SulP family inorganic anion transporter [Betaproteobacteria bacterium]
MPTLALKLLPFLRWRHRVTPVNLRADAIAGLLGALIVLPQGVAYATLAGLPPQYGLYCAMLPAIVAALWGSSWHQISGPTNALSLVIFATIAPLAVPQTPDYITLVLTLALLVGFMQFALGVARLGTLVNFISQTVIVGFTAGAGLLIIAAQLKNFFGVDVPAGANFFASVRTFGSEIASINPAVTATGATTLLTALAAKRLLPRIPYMIVGMVAGSVFGYALTRFTTAQIPTVGALPSGLPQLSFPSVDPEVWRQLIPAALALTVLGLTEAVSIARAIAVKSGQRIDGNQEFIGQGLSNLVGAFSSAYPSSGSFNRSGVNFAAGAKTPLAAVLSAVFLIVVLLAVAPLAAFLPLAVMAALLFIVAWSLIDFSEMRRIARTHRGDLLVLAVTFAATLTIALEFAIFVGVLASLLVYLQRTTHPRVIRVLPEAETPQRRFVPVAEGAALCPQLDILRVEGSLFFGAVEHVRNELAVNRALRPAVRHCLLVCSGVNFIDVAGCELLAQEAKLARDAGGALYLCNVRLAVRDTLKRGGFDATIGRDRMFATKDAAMRAIYAQLEVSTCAACTARVFVECNLALPDGTPRMS